MAAFALTGYAAYKLGFLEVAHHHRLKNGELEAVPLSGRLRPALPAVTAMERRVRSQEVVGKRSDAALQRVARDGGFYYPADHPLTLKAQAICQQLLPAAMLLLEEHHGRDSPVVAQVKGHFADWQPVIKVYHAEGDSSQGFASQGFIAVRDTLSVPIIAHELGHTICRHATESAASSKAFSSTWVPWAFTTYLGHLVTMRPTGSVVLFALARNILLYRATKSPPTVLRSSKAKKLPGTARLQPGDVGYNSVESPSRDIDHELEAERMAMFIMARLPGSKASVRRLAIDFKDWLQHLELLEWHGSLEFQCAGEGTLTRAAKLRQVAQLFVRGVATYTACDAAAVIVAGQDISVTAQVGFLAAYAGYESLLEGLAKLRQNPSTALAKFLDKAGLRPSLTPKLPLRLSAPTHIAVCALAGYAAYKLDFLGVAHHHRLKQGEWEAVPLSGRQRPALPAVTAKERKLRSQEFVEERSNSALQRAAEKGGFYYPADHPVTLQAQAICQQLLPAAILMLEEHHGKDSPVVTRVKEHVADWQPVIKVYHAEGDSPGGFAGIGYIALRDTLRVPAIAHEIGHTICRHVTESAENSSAWTWTWIPWALPAYFGHLLTMRPPESVTTYLMARNLLLLVTTLFPVAATKANAMFLQEEPAGVARLQHGEVGYNSVDSPSMDIDYELEAERMAMFIMARAGYNPALVLHQRGIFGPKSLVPKDLLRWEGLSKHHVSHLVRLLQAWAGDQPQELTTISRAELAEGTDTAWPNLAKLFAMYAEVLPAATDVFRLHRGPQPAIRWPPRLPSFKPTAAGLADS
ncbi:hypothetical protein N2152v2_000651 [Parachlorella kessleri]